MFMLTLLTAYSIPALYIYFRLKNLFTGKSSKNRFTLLYILLVLVFPISEFFFHRAGSGLAKFLETVSFYITPFMLYLFLAVLLLDVLRGLNHLFKIVPKEVIQGRKFRMTALLTLLLVSASVVVIGVIHFNTLRVSSYKITVPRKSSAITHLKVAMAADFHLGQTVGKGFAGDFLTKINSIKPDIVLIPGDIVEGHSNDGDMEEFVDMFRQVKSKYGIYACLGNHESHSSGSKMDFFEKAGIHVLTDTFEVIDHSFVLLGRNDNHSNNRRPLEELFKNIPHEFPLIVMDHRPIGLEQVSLKPVDIQVSGHTHNGQLFPVNLIINGIYELGWGYRKIRGTHFFVTSGIRVWGPQVRTAGNSEIMVIDVDFKGLHPWRLCRYD